MEKSILKKVVKVCAFLAFTSFSFSSCDNPSNISSGKIYQSRINLKSPEDLRVSPLVLDKDNVVLSWKAVEGADYYKIYCYDAQSWKNGSEPVIKFIDDPFQESAQLSVQDEATRYVFCIKACKDYSKSSGSQVRGVNEETSPESNYTECVVAPKISTSAAIIDDFVHMFFTTSSRESLLEDGKEIFTPTFFIYKDGEVVDSVTDSDEWVSPEPVESNSQFNYGVGMRVESVDIRGDEADSAGVIQIEQKSEPITLKSDVNYNPFHIKRIDLIENGRRPNVVLEFESSGINSGVEGAELAYEITRNTINAQGDVIEKVCIYDDRKPDFNNIITLENDSENPLVYRFSDTVEPNKDYNYFVRTYYKFTKENENGESSSVFYAEKSSTAVKYSDTAYVQSDISDFSSSLETVKDEHGNEIINPVTDSAYVYKNIIYTSSEDYEGNVTYTVNLSWDVEHFDSQKSYFDIIRKDLSSPTKDEVKVNSEPVRSKSFTDYITISLDEDKKSRRYGYEVLYYLSSDEKDSEPVRISLAENVKTVASVAEVQYIKSASISDTSSNVSGAFITLEPIDLADMHVVSESKTCDLNPEYLTYYLFRSKNPSGYDTSDTASAVLSVKRSEISSNSYVFRDINLDDDSQYYYAICALYDGDDFIDNRDYNGSESVYDTSLSTRTMASVKNINATLSESIENITVNWNEVESASGYELYAKAAGTSAWQLVSTILGQESTEYKFTQGAGTQDAGKLWDFKVRAFGDTLYSNTPSYTAFSPEAQGSIFGVNSIGVSVASREYNGANFTNDIVLSWNEVKNASGYIVNVYSDSELRNNIRQEKLSADARSYTFDSSKITVDIEYPLSRGYYFTVTPYLSTATGDVKVANSLVNSFAKYSSFAIQPPKNIVATKADYTDKVDISWQSVSGISIYDVYRREVDSTSFEPIGSWDNIATGVNTNSYSDKNVEEGKIYQYTIASVNSKYDKVTQSYFNVVDKIYDNIGLILGTPKLYSNSEFSSSGKIVFYDVLFANDYELVVYNPANPNGKVYSNYDSGVYNANKKVQFTVSGNDKISIIYVRSISKSGAKSTPYVVNLLGAKEVVEWSNVALKKAIAVATSLVNNDWWLPYSTDKTIRYNSDKTVKALARFTHGTLSQGTSTYSYGFSKYGGVFQLINYGSADNIILNSDEIRVWANSEYKLLKDAPNNAIEQIGEQGYGTCTVKLVNGDTAKIHYMNINVNGTNSSSSESGGSGYEVTLNWKSSKQTIQPTSLSSQYRVLQ